MTAADREMAVAVCALLDVYHCVVQFLVQRSKLIVANPLSSCDQATHRMFRETRDCLDIRFGFEGQNCLRLSRFRDAMLGVQIYEMASCCAEQRVLVWIIHFSFHVKIP